MKILFFIAAFLFLNFSDAAEFTWSKKLVADLKAKNLDQVFCDSPKYFSEKACAELGKNQNLHWKLKSVSLEDPKTLMLTVDRSTIRVARGSAAHLFLINQKEIDLNEFSNPVELQQKIKSLVPKKSAKFSLWISEAYAENFETDKQYADALSDAVTLVLSSTKDSEICESAMRVADLCRQGGASGQRFLGIVDIITKKINSREEITWSKLRVYTQMLNESSARLRGELDVIMVQLGRVVDKKSVIEKCELKEKPWEVIKGCEERIGVSLLALTKRPNPGQDWKIAEILQPLKAQMEKLDPGPKSPFNKNSFEKNVEVKQ